MKSIYRALGILTLAGIFSCSQTENKDAETTTVNKLALDPLAETQKIFTKITAKYDSVSVEENDSTVTFYVIPKSEDYDFNKELFGAFTIEKTGIVVGDLNQDGLEDAVVKYYYTPHLENYSLMYYKVLLQKNGTLDEVTEIYGGSRCEGPIMDVQKIEKGLIKFSGVEFASGDPCCCPTIKKDYVYKIVDGAAVEIN